ncbi:MAG TPA: O-antigen ligase family protein [Candidatus Limnocylindria bacterium]
MPRRLAEVAAVGIGLAVLFYAGWDGALWDPRYQLALHLAAVAVFGGLLWVALSGGELPRTPLDIPILALLLAFAVASLTAWNPGLSARALAAIVAMAVMLPALLLALRHRPDWTALVVTVPVLALSLHALAVLAWRRVEWLMAGGTGLPPVRLDHEGTIFGALAVPAFVVIGALPVALLTPHPRLRRGMLIALAAVAVPLTLLSGSRSAWLAAAVAGLVLVAPTALRRLRPGWSGLMARGRRLSPRDVGLAVMGLALVAVAIAFIAPRLTDARSLVYRGFLYRDTLAAWSQDPLFGIGPGSMPLARQAAAPPLSFPVRQPHSHDVALGILGDAGLIGLAAAAVLFVTFVVVAGPWRTRSLSGRAAFAVLMGFAAGMLFEDLTFLPAFNLLVVLLAAIALLDAGAVRWLPIARAARLPLGVVAGIGAIALVAIMAVGDAGAIAYRNGIDAAGDGRWPESYAALRQSSRLDPWNPAAPRALAVVADRLGLTDEAQAAAEEAVRLSPGDGASWTNLAVLCREQHDRGCARRAADRAVDTATPQDQELINAAVVYQWLGDTDAADRAYRLSMLTNYLTGLTQPWPRPITIGSVEQTELNANVEERNLLVARRLAGEPIRVDDYDGPLTRALAAAMIGDQATAEEEVRRGLQRDPSSTAMWEVAALLGRHYGTDDGRLERVADATRGQGLPDPTQPPTLTYDIATFRALPGDGLVSRAVRLVPEQPWPWVLEPLLAPAGG